MGSIPRPGDEIYVYTSLYLSHGVDDVRGGRATVTRVETEMFGDRSVPFVEVAEHPGWLYNWEHLAEQQTQLAARFGELRARPDPDMRPQFNDDMMTEAERAATYQPVLPRAGAAPESARAPASLLAVALGFARAFGRGVSLWRRRAGSRAARLGVHSGEDDADQEDRR